MKRLTRHAVERAVPGAQFIELPFRWFHALDPTRSVFAQLEEWVCTAFTVSPEDYLERVTIGADLLEKLLSFERLWLTRCPPSADLDGLVPPRPRPDSILGHRQLVGWTVVVLPIGGRARFEPGGEKAPRAKADAAMGERSLARVQLKKIRPL